MPFNIHGKFGVFDADDRGGQCLLQVSTTRDNITFNRGNSGLTLTPSGTDGPASTAFCYGTITQINNFLAGRTTGTIVNTASTTGAVTITVSVTDEDGHLGSKVITGTVANLQSPVVSVPVGGDLQCDVGVAKTLTNIGFGVTDSDDTGDFATGFISVPSPHAITIDEGNSGVTVTSGNGGQTVNFTGTISAINTLFTTGSTGTVVMTPGGTDTNKLITLSVTDSTLQTGSNTKQFDVLVKPTIDPPNSYLTVLNGVNLNIHSTIAASQFTISDADAGATSNTMVLSATNGNITVTAGTSGVTGITGSGTHSVSMTGTLAQLNALLHSSGGAAGTIVYNSTVNATEAFTVTVTDVTARVGVGSVQIVTSAAIAWTGYVEATPTAAVASLTDFVYIIDLAEFPQAWWDLASADGRDIRVTDSSVTNLPRDIIYYDKTLQQGYVMFKHNHGTSPDSFRVYTGAPGAAVIADGNAIGRDNVYNTTYYKGVWPRGAGEDRTTKNNDITGFNNLTEGDVTGPFGATTATDYQGNKYGYKSSATDAGDFPEMFIAYMNPSDRTSDTVISSAEGVLTNILQLKSSKVIARTITVSATGSETSKVTAQAVGDVSKGSWQCIAGAFYSGSNRVAYRSGGNSGGNTDGTVASGSTKYYCLGATLKNYTSPSTGIIVDKHFDGYISLAMVLTVANNIGFEYANQYNLMLDQSTYWSTWNFTPASQTGL